MKKAFLFDLNGTMVDDMDFHIDAWLDVINNDLGGSFDRQRVKMEMYGKGEEVLARVFGENQLEGLEMSSIIFEKEKKYQDVFRPHLKLIDGLHEFLEKAHQHQVLMGIGSAAITFNIDYVLDGLNIRRYFPVTISADNVEKSKPDPETFLKGAEQLGVEPENSIVFEDNPKGVQAALNAGMKAVVITTMHKEHEFEGLPNILKFIKDYRDPFLDTLL